MTEKNFCDSIRLRPEYIFEGEEDAVFIDTKYNPTDVESEGLDTRELALESVRDQCNFCELRNKSGVYGCPYPEKRT